MFGPIALAYNLDGVTTLVVNADVLAKIFSGAITDWNDPAIAALNPGATLPDDQDHARSTARTPRAPPTTSRNTWPLPPRSSWTKGAGNEFQGGVGEGAQKSAGVVQAVQATPGAIGYVEKGFADQGDLPYAQHRQRQRRGRADRRLGRARPSTPPSSPAEGNDLALDLNALYSTRGSGRLPADAGHLRDRLLEGLRRRHLSAAVKSFLTVAANHGQAGLSQAGYVPLPDTFKERLLSRDQTRSQ